ncbi:MAG: enoyl-CoA hydratase/isomerase family protein [Solirubrobacteraceae bacterium]
MSSTDDSASDWVPPAEARRLAAGKLLLDHPADQVARLTIANPAKRNALDHPILDALAQALRELDARCVLITGAHGMFSAGYDIGGMPEETFADQAESLVAHPFAEAIEAIEAYPYPVVAALPGHAIGGGLEVALSADLRVAAAGIRVGMPPAKLGLVYSHTGIQKFLDTIGAARTRELFLVGRNIPVQTALSWGLVNQVVDAEALQERALELAREIAANAPLSLSGNKRIIRELLAAAHGLDPEVERELVELRRACFASEDFREGVRAFGEKREPHWRAR